MNTHDRQRRMVLQFALGTGCAMAVPVIIAGCGQDKGTSAAASRGSEPLANGAAAGTAAEKPGAQAGRLIPKAQAQYQEQPKGDQKCGNCQQFIAATSSCRVVEGRVSPEGWCMFWAKKA